MSFALHLCLVKVNPNGTKPKEMHEFRSFRTVASLISAMILVHGQTVTLWSWYQLVFNVSVYHGN